MMAARKALAASDTAPTPRASGSHNLMPYSCQVGIHLGKRALDLRLERAWGHVVMRLSKYGLPGTNGPTVPTSVIDASLDRFVDGERL